MVSRSKAIKSEKVMRMQQNECARESDGLICSLRVSKSVSKSVQKV